MSKPSDTDRYHFRHSFERLPPEEQDLVLTLLKWATLYRSGGGLRDIALRRNIKEIARVFGRNGMELEEYT